MRLIYAVQFRVDPVQPGHGMDVPQSARAMACAWISKWYKSRKDLDVTVPESSLAIEPIPGHKIQVASQSTVGGEWLWEVGWTYPGDPDPSLMWHSTCIVASKGSHTEVSITVRIASPAYVISPLYFVLKRPQIVKSLAESFVCTLGGRSVLSGPQPVGLEDVGSLVEYLRSEDRCRPVVLFSREPFSEKCLASPARCADSLVGLADVFVMNDKWVSFQLTDMLGRDLSCFNGSVRTYWPKMSATPSPSLHRRLSEHEVQRIAVSDEAFASYMLRRIAPLSAYRFTELPITKEVRAALVSEGQVESLRLKKQIEAGSAEKGQLEKDVLGVIEANDALRAKLKDAEKDRDDAQLRVLELDEELRLLKENLAEIGKYRETNQQGSDDRAIDDDDPDPKSVLDALVVASRKCSDRLHIWESARDAATDSRFRRPVDVYRALVAIAEVAKEYHDSRTARRSMGPIDQAFEKRGLKYSPGESQNTMNMYGKDRVFSNAGERRQFVRHLTLGGGDRENCAQIYFELHESNGKAIIAYCGLHLPYYGMRT